MYHPESLTAYLLRRLDQLYYKVDVLKQAKYFPELQYVVAQLKKDGTL